MENKQAKRKAPRHQVGIEVSQSELALVVAEQTADGGRSVRGHHLTWLQAANSLDSQEGILELTAAVSTLVASEKLGGATVHVALSSDFCVTRVAVGETEKVSTELQNLHDRSSQYLLLGPGEKAAAKSSRAIDAKQRQAWLTVTNKRTLDNVIHAVQDAGLQVGMVEHAMVAMCRAVGMMGRDTESPVIVIEVNQGGVDLGISFQGQLLFDYRPGGMDCKGRIAEIANRHLERIQRYCNRQFRFATGKISQVFICGEPEEVEQICRQFDEVANLTAEALDTRAVLADGEYDPGFTMNSRLAAALGTALVEGERLHQLPEERGFPDLMDFFRKSMRQPLVPTLTKLAWPIAAMLLLALGIASAGLLTGRKAAAIERQQVQLEVETGRVRQMRMETQAATTKIGYLQRIDDGLLSPAWHDLLALIRRSMPEGLWLEGIRVEHDRTATIIGSSRSEDLIFDFMRYLKQIPVLENVNLESQQPITVAAGPAIRFDVKCRYDDREDSPERTTSDD